MARRFTSETTLTGTISRKRARTLAVSYSMWNVARKNCYDMTLQELPDGLLNEWFCAAMMLKNIQEITGIVLASTAGHYYEQLGNEIDRRKTETQGN